MKKLFLFISALCMSAMVMAGKNVVFDFTDISNPWKLPTSYEIGENSYTYGGYTVKINGAGYLDKETQKGGAYLYVNKDTSVVCLLMGKKGSYITLPAFDFNVSQIKVNAVEGGSGSVTFNVYVGDQTVSSKATGCNVDQLFKIDPTYQAKGNVYTIQVTNANNIRLGKIEVMEAVADQPEDPVFSPKGGTYSKAQQISIACATDGAEIKYSYDGSTYLDYSEPLQVENTQTIYAKAVKNSVESNVVSATYTIVSTEGDGTKENPYTVADLAILNNPGDTAWVEGYILGCSKDKGRLTDVDTVNTNILLGANLTDSVGVPVMLSKKADKEALGLKDNPTNKGKKLLVQGALVSYFSTTGVKNVVEYELEGGAAIITTQEDKAVVRKMIVNGQVVLIKDGKYYDVLGCPRKD